MTHDYKRNGTTDVFAALNLPIGEVIGVWTVNGRDGAVWFDAGW